MQARKDPVTILYHPALSGKCKKFLWFASKIKKNQIKYFKLHKMYVFIFWCVFDHIWAYLTKVNCRALQRAEKPFLKSKFDEINDFI